jgi:hypothetical protein
MYQRIIQFVHQVLIKHLSLSHSPARCLQQCNQDCLRIFLGRIPQHRAFHCCPQQSFIACRS